MEVIDSKTTIPYNEGLAAHNLKYTLDPEYKNAVDYASWASKDKPLEDKSLMLTLLPGIFTSSTGMGLAAAYSNAPMTIASRIATSVKEGTPRSIIGVPKKEHIKKFMSDRDAREKVLWTGTGNSVKYSNLNSD